MDAYLVIREGTKWTDVVRMVAGRTVMIGRAPTNQIVIKDERCSRNHAEIFFTGGCWTLRDHDSRNGSLVNGQPIAGDYLLQPRDVIRIAKCQMAFVHELSEAVGDAFSADPVMVSGEQDLENIGGTDLAGDSSVIDDTFAPTTITHRRGKARLLDRHEDPSGLPKVGRAVAALCRIAFDLAKQLDVTGMAETALAGIFEDTAVDAGAILLAPRGLEEKPVGADLEVVASQSREDARYHRITGFLASTVLGDGEAVLARNIGDDSVLASRDSKGEIESTSVICAPIRHDNTVLGIVHLYSTRSERTLDPDDLEFTLAVADNLGLAIQNLNREQGLADDLDQTRNEVQQLRSQLGVESDIVGNSPLLEEVRNKIKQTAPSRATVLIRGESGVGKELVARAVHYASPRSGGPFVCLNCAAISESLLESELFGHEKGSFTGATDRKIGKFEAADGGTLMLDEIGEMSSSTQAKFLRVLEGHPFERVGGIQAIKVDVRVIAATNRDLEAEVSAGNFRRDLYFRLHVVEIVVPPLRKRQADVETLAYFFLSRFREETGRRVGGFSEAAMERMEKYQWPGNVRELKNMIERAVVLCPGEIIEVSDLTLSSIAPAGDSDVLPAAGGEYQALTIAEVERIHIMATLEQNNWNKSRSAGVLGIERSTLDRKINRYEIVPQNKS
jgi:Nif-specific regulatory protein